MAGPAWVPARKIEFVIPRSPMGTHSRTTRPPAGNVAASPMPMARRMAMSEAKFHAAPVAMVAADHSAIPAALTALVPNRSTRMPIGNKHSR